VLKQSGVREEAKMRSILNEFKTFALRGNVIDLAVGVIIGAAFGKIVSSAVNNLLMPFLGIFLGKVDFSNLFINLSGKPVSSLKEATDKGLAVIGYGAFLNSVIEFLIVALVLFLIIKQINLLVKPAPAPAKEPSAEEKLLTEIRDILKAQS
jgi:large conductance mechanosensitive channel